MSYLHRRIPTVAAFLCLAGFLRAEIPSAPAAPTLTSEQIVREMERRDGSRREGLRHYWVLRHYEATYKGFGARLDAKMEVEVTYDTLSGKTFRVVGQSGSKILLDKVLKRLIATEEEAAADQASTALTATNYNFTLEGMEPVAGRPAYILSVEPLTQNKLLYRGKVWVDAVDFAVVKIDARPARNPSAWIASTRIHHTYAKTGDFWLPEENRSESKIRVGGSAVLTIDYGDYQIQAQTRRAAAK